MTDRYIRLVLALAAGVAALSWNGEISPTSAGVSTAHAIIGRPLTPMSFAGVARRTAWRGYGYGYGYGGAYIGAYRPPVVIAPPIAAVVPPGGCIQVVNAYGQLTYRC